MAAIDKIYLNSEDYKEFKKWCEEQPPLKDKYGKSVKLTNYLYKYNDDESYDCKPAFMAPYYVDAYVIRNCPIDGVQKELMINYGHWSQERIKEFYNDVVNWNGDEDYPYWAKKEDFEILEDGTIILEGLEKSDYEKIKDGEMYTSPKRDDYTYGKHFKCTKHPKCFYNRPFKCGSWFVDIEIPEEYGFYMWYSPTTKTWDFADEFVSSEWRSSTAHCKTIKALKRHMLKWKLPIGTVVRATGRYTFDDYEFVITK